MERDQEDKAREREEDLDEAAAAAGWAAADSAQAGNAYAQAAAIECLTAQVLPATRSNARNAGHP